MKIIFPCFRLFLVLTVLTGMIYPLAVTAIAQVLFHHQAQGSLVTVDQKVVGSQLLSQKTQSPRYFWPRPSADDFATVASGASNLGPSSDALKKAIADRAAQIRAADGLGQDGTIPDDLLTASASGLDPEISPEAARLQIDRVARARNFTGPQLDQLKQLVESEVQAAQCGVFGQPRVNVLMLNLALDRLK